MVSAAGVPSRLTCRIFPASESGSCGAGPENVSPVPMYSEPSAGDDHAIRVAHDIPGDTEPLVDDLEADLATVRQLFLRVPVLGWGARRAAH